MLYFSSILIHEFTSKLGSLLPLSIYCHSKFYMCKMKEKKITWGLILGKVMLCSLPQYFLIAKHKS